MLKDKLKEYRMACGLSQQQVADLLNVHRSTYSYYELGTTEPSLDNLLRLSRMFRVDLYELLELERPGGLMVIDPDYSNGETTRIGDLTREEKMLVLRYRLLTQSQQNDLLVAMLTRDDLQPHDEDE